jgi:hypothetical protein
MRTGAFSEVYARRRRLVLVADARHARSLFSFAWNWPESGHAPQCLRVAFRSFRKRPGFSATVVATLALGLGATTTVFSVVLGVMLKLLPSPAQNTLSHSGTQDSCAVCG